MICVGRYYGMVIVSWSKYLWWIEQGSWSILYFRLLSSLHTTEQQKKTKDKMLQMFIDLSSPDRVNPSFSPGNAFHPPTMKHLEASMEASNGASSGHEFVFAEFLLNRDKYGWFCSCCCPRTKCLKAVATGKGESKTLCRGNGDRP